MAGPQTTPGIHALQAAASVAVHRAPASHYTACERWQQCGSRYAGVGSTNTRRQQQVAGEVVAVPRHDHSAILELYHGSQGCYH